MSARPSSTIEPTAASHAAATRTPKAAAASARASQGRALRRPDRGRRHPRDRRRRRQPQRRYEDDGLRARHGHRSRHPASCAARRRGQRPRSWHGRSGDHRHDLRRQGRDDHTRSGPDARHVRRPLVPALPTGGPPRDVVAQGFGNSDGCDAASRRHGNVVHAAQLPAVRLAGEGEVPDHDDRRRRGERRGRAYGLTSYPYFVALDKTGKVLTRASGELTQAQFEGLITAARTGRAAAA